MFRKIIILIILIFSLQSCQYFPQPPKKEITLDRVEDRKIDAELPAKIELLDTLHKPLPIDTVRIVLTKIDTIIKYYNLKSKIDTVIVSKIKMIRVENDRIDTVFREVPTAVKVEYDYNTKQFHLKLSQKKDSIFTRMNRMNTIEKKSLLDNLEDFILLIIKMFIICIIILIIFNKLTKK